MNLLSEIFQNLQSKVEVQNQEELIQKNKQALPEKNNWTAYSQNTRDTKQKTNAVAGKQSSPKSKHVRIMRTVISHSTLKDRVASKGIFQDLKLNNFQYRWLSPTKSS